MTVYIGRENATFPIDQRPFSKAIRSSLSRLRTSSQAWILRHIVADDPKPELSQLDQLDRIHRGNEPVNYSGVE